MFLETRRVVLSVVRLLWDQHEVCVLGSVGTLFYYPRFPSASAIPCACPHQLFPDCVPSSGAEWLQQTRALVRAAADAGDAAPETPQMSPEGSLAQREHRVHAVAAMLRWLVSMMHGVTN